MARKALAVWILLALAGYCIDQPANAADMNQTRLTVNQLLTEIQKGINEAYVKIDKQKFPPLGSVTLTLQTETKFDGDAKLNLWFVKVGGGASKGTSSTMTLVLKPPKQRTNKQISTESFDQTLADAIVGAAKGVDAAANGDPPLLLDSFSAEINFSVSKNVQGGVEFKLLPVGGGADGKLSDSSSHKLVVKFARPEKSS